MNKVCCNDLGTNSEDRNSKVILNGKMERKDKKKSLSLNSSSPKNGLTGKRKSTTSVRRKKGLDETEKIDHGSPPSEKGVLHFIRKRRLEVGLSIEKCAKMLGISVEEAKRQEDPFCNLNLTQLYAWEDVLGGDLQLLKGGSSLRNPIADRAFVLKFTKTNRSLSKECKKVSPSNKAIQYWSQTMDDMIIDYLPEYKDVQPWSEYGKSHEPKNGYRTFRTGNPYRPYGSDSFFE